MEIQTWKISAVKPYDKNPRRNDEAVDAVAASLREFGFQQPLVVDRDGIVIVGHTRLKAAKKLGMKEVPVVVADTLTPEQVKAYRLADNKTGELAGWDFSLLDRELSELDDMEIDLTEFGFDVGGAIENNEQAESALPEMQTENLDKYRYVHYLVTVDVCEHDRFLPKLRELEAMGAIVKETRNNT